MLLLDSEALYLVTEVIVVLCVMILICTHTHTHHAYTQTPLMSPITLVNVLEGDARFYMSSLGDHCFDYCTALKHHPILKTGDISRFTSIFLGSVRFMYGQHYTTL